MTSTLRAVVAASLLPSLLCLACGIPQAYQLGRAEGMMDVGERLFDDGKFAQSEASYQRAIATGALPKEKEAEAWTAIGNTRHQRDDHEGAIVAHDRALALRPAFPAALVNKGVCWRALQRFDEAETQYRASIALDPRYAHAHASLGALHLHRDETDEAVAILEEAVAIDDSLAVAHANLALAYGFAGRHSDAQASLRKAILRGYTNAPVVRERLRQLSPERRTD